MPSILPTSTHAPLLEAVPNISAGRGAECVARIVARTKTGACSAGMRDGSVADVVDVHRDIDHDRSVLTIIGWGAAFSGALDALARAAVALIDIHDACGVHPRVGALDVVPVLPIVDAPDGWRDAHAQVERCARTLGDDLRVPVIAYGLDASGVPCPGAATSGAVRRGGPTETARRVAAGELALRAGPRVPHATAGMTMCGVRPLLVAFNVDLACDDVSVAQRVARAIRGTSGGPDALPGVRALGLWLAERGVVQVSTNIDAWQRTSPAAVLRAVHAIAACSQVNVCGAELVGLAPLEATDELRDTCALLEVPLAAALDPALEHAAQCVADMRNSSP